MEASDYHAVSIGSWDSALTSGTAAALAGAGAGAAGGGGYQAGLQTTGSGGGTGQPTRRKDRPRVASTARNAIRVCTA